MDQHEGMGLTNWAGNVAYGAAQIHRPESVDELRRVVAGGERIRALGSGHSFSRVADTTGDLVRLDALPPTIEIDAAGRTVTVGAGMRYADVAAVLHQNGLALPNMASLPHISVAGSCATGTHGSGDTLRSLSASVTALELVGPDGTSQHLRRAGAPERVGAGGDPSEGGGDRAGAALSGDGAAGTGGDVFCGAVVALGALGVVARVTLEVEAGFEVAQRVRVGVPLDEVAARFDEVFGAAYSVSAFTDWRSGEASVWLKCRAGWPVPEWDGGRAAPAAVHPVPGMDPDFCTLQMGVPGPWHERLPHFRPEMTPSAGQELQSEWFLPRDAASGAFAEVRAMADKVAPVLHISEVRTVRGDDLWLSPAYGRDSVTLHFTWLDDPGAVLPVVAELEERLVPLGARPHWGKVTSMAGSEIIAGYERAADFARLASKFDPGGKFRNAFIDALFG